jgi:16S rRNA C967 or C1407 C5-methylase (RsmB/RsmF family)
MQKMQETGFTPSFAAAWSELFSSTTHLDSILSKQTKSMKSLLARTIPAILLRPSSLAEALGIGVPQGEPWTLGSPESLARWRPAQLIGEAMEKMIREGAPVESLAVTPSEADFPPKMIAAWKATWGEDGAARLVQSLGSPPPLSLRARAKLGAWGLYEELREGLPVRAKTSEFAPFGVRLEGYAPVLGTPAFERGEFEIQDEGSQVMSLFALWPELYGKLLGKTPGDIAGSLVMPGEARPWNIVDACAGAGGKTLAIADAMAGKGRVYSYDTSGGKLQALRRRATRAGYNNTQAVTVVEGEEEKTVGKFRKRANVVLVDAPCSGWGVLRRNSDIKWRQGADVLERMPALQSRLLSVYSDLVASGGHLVFGVCTFRPEETTAVVQRFLEQHRDFEAREGGYLGPGPCDGFFMQAFSRK